MSTSSIMKDFFKHKIVLFLIFFLLCTSLVTFSAETKADASINANGLNGPLNIPVPVTSWAQRPQGDGGWAISSDGGVFTYGAADFWGAGNAWIKNTVTAAFSSPSGRGYTMVTDDGGVFTFGDAQNYGAANRWVKNTVTAAFPTANGNGYTLVTEDGGVFTFGGAVNRGAGNAWIRNTVAAAFPSLSGQGYTLVTDDGGVFTFGDAQNRGVGNSYIRNQVTAAFPTSTGNGYWMITDDGGTFTFGDAQWHGTSNACRTSIIVAGASSTTSMKYWTISSQGELRQWPNNGITCIAPTISTGPCAQNSLPQRVYISIGQQHLWACQGGTQVYDSAVTTGAVSNGHGTPTGTFKIYSKETDRYLTGPGYRAHVDYWMPFLRGYGLHDASWRRVFGVQSFTSSGSHGCVNMPKVAAKWMFGWSKVGTTVTLY